MIELKYISYKPGIAYGNLMFVGKSFPMENGNFPKDHPFASGSDGMKTYPQIGTSEKLEALRSLGYYISCFPEGDGMCFAHSQEKNQSQVIDEISKALDVKLITV